MKNFANDFRNVPLFIYGYQDRFRAIPGDDAAVVAHLGAAATLATTPAGTVGNGTINGNWDSPTLTDESVLFWQHARLANLAAGSTTVANDATYWPTNADSGRIGIEAGSSNFIQNVDAGGAANGTFLQGAYVICSGSILGRFALQLDTTMDDGNPQTGSLRVVLPAHARGAIATTTAVIQAAPAANYTVCMGL